jgi:hypothetical protein
MFPSRRQSTGAAICRIAVRIVPCEALCAPVLYAPASYFHEVDKLGHIACSPEPELFSPEIRAAFSSLG